MRYSTQVLVLAALGLELVVAQPAGSVHRHLHKHKKDLADINWKDPAQYTGVNWATVNYGGSAPAATAAPVVTSPAPAIKVVVATGGAKADAKAKAKPTTTSTSKAASTGISSNAGSVLYKPSGCPTTGFGAQTSPISNGNVDEYIGNVGSPYGCNMIMVDSVNGYTYTTTFTNSGSSPMSIIIWNKSGKDGQPNSGQSSTPNLGFTIAAGASQIVAFDEDSQVAWSKNCGRSEYGMPDCTYGEADFGNTSNGGWSGYDVSSIQNSAGNTEVMSITSSASNGGKASSNTSNNWVAADQSNQGAGGSIPPEANPVCLVATMQ